MSFSSKCRETADACRFCWMCRHICPVGNTTGQERNTARARALSLSLVGRGAAELYSGYKTVVFYDPEDARTAKQDAPELGITAKAKLVTFPAYLETLIGKKLKVKKSENVYTFQDPAALARALEDVSSARAVLAACGELKEMLLAGKETVLAGDLILDRYLHEVVLGMARRRWDEAVNMGARTLVTADTAEYLALSATKPKGVRVITLEEAVAECL